MDFQVLGPLVVMHHEQAVEVPTTKIRALLALLVVRVGRLANTDTLVEELWHGRPPGSAVNVLQKYVGQLRDLLEPEREPRGPGRYISTVPGGYLLSLPPERIDSHRFERFVDDGVNLLNAGDPQAAGKFLRTGLALWRDAAYVDVPEMPSVNDEARRLEDRRLVALERRLEADIACGGYHESTAELEDLHRKHPNNEAFLMLLMRALYGAGRQTDALTAHDAFRTRMREESGLDPSPALDHLQRQILTHHNDLARTPQPATTAASIVFAETAPPPTTAARTIRAEPPAAIRRRLVPLAVLTALLAAAAAAWGVSSAGTGDPGHRLRGAAVPTGPLNEFDLMVMPGVGYDLDILPGQPVSQHAGAKPSTPEYRYLDLYRTWGGEDQLGGVDFRQINDYNTLTVVPSGADSAYCRALPTGAAGKAVVSRLSVGSQICLNTNDGRWALITVRELPATRLAPLRVHIALAAD